jgi:hypothetical protein
MSDEVQETGVLTEPVIVPCLFVTGWGIEIADGSVRIIGWVDLPYLGGQTRERRIVARFAMSDGTARQFNSDFRKKLLRDKH